MDRQGRKALKTGKTHYPDVPPSASSSVFALHALQRPQGGTPLHQRGGATPANTTGTNRFAVNVGSPPPTVTNDPALSSLYQTLVDLSVEQSSLYDKAKYAGFKATDLCPVIFGQGFKRCDEYITTLTCSDSKCPGNSNNKVAAHGFYGINAVSALAAVNSKVNYQTKTAMTQLVKLVQVFLHGYERNLNSGNIRVNVKGVNSSTGPKAQAPLPPTQPTQATQIPTPSPARSGCVLQSWPPNFIYSQCL